MAERAEAEVAQMRQELIQLAASLGLKFVDEHASARLPADPEREAPQEHLTDDGQMEKMTIALAWISVRRRRDEVFGQDLFADPAWDMLLELYISHHRDIPVCVTSLCVASTVPGTTALRWISVLEKRELVHRRPDPKDGRRSYIELTAKGMELMERAMERARDSDRKLGLGRLRLIK